MTKGNETDHVTPVLQSALEVDHAQRSCIGKKRYVTEDGALGVARLCWDKRRVSLRAYACELCGGWHLTKRDAAPVMREGWRQPAKSTRQLAFERKRNDRNNGRRRARKARPTR